MLPLPCQFRLASAPFAAIFILLSILDLPALAQELPAAQIENKRCANCHGQSNIVNLSEAERRSMVAPATRPGSSPAPGPRPGLHVTASHLAGSVHASLACIDCHRDAKGLPHPARLAKATCDASCHTSARSDYLQGAHAAAAARRNAAPTCATCHGSHDIFRKDQRQSRTHPLNIVKVCGDCHGKHRSSNGQEAEPGKSRVAQYLESVHGRAVTRGGMAVAATCDDCHHAHKVLPSSDPRSTTHRGSIPLTCGKCHVGVSEIYRQSVHGELSAQGNGNSPVCSDCHTAHAITRTNTPSFMLDIVNECGQCHDKPAASGRRRSSLYDTYRLSYHGQVTELGSTRAARCSDCHGAHDVHRIGDPRSRLNQANRLDTCRSCHPTATAGFTSFEPHADYRDAKRFPLLHGVWLYFIIMMSFAFGFYGLHSALWLVRSLIERAKHGSHPQPPANPHAIQRFNRVDRVNHAFVIISFFGLTLTGIPLLYSDKIWAKAMTEFFGGVKSAGLLHRFFALMLIGNFVVHFVGVVRRFRRHGIKQMLFGPATMLPRLKDVRDCLGMFRWFFLGGKKPAFDRWTYWEKFDYVAEVGGSMIIGLSGLMLWFPEFFAQFLPGWMFNVATIVHGYEALLAIGFIFTIHFFNAHLRLEKFPVDDVIFTGRLSEHEFKEERGAEYERLVREGKLEALKVAPPSPFYQRLAVVVGVAAMAVGTTLVALIILAALGVV